MAPSRILSHPFVIQPTLDDADNDVPAFRVLGTGYGVSAAAMVSAVHQETAVQPYPASIDLSALDGTDGFAIIGGSDNFIGRAASGADVNGDGFSDIIIGSPASRGDGSAFVVFGNAGSAAPSIDIASLVASTGFAINGFQQNQFTGGAVSTAGDFNGDGIDDIVVGALGDGGQHQPGAAYIVFGRVGNSVSDIDLSSINGANGIAFTGSETYGHVGTAVANAGDVNGDGFSDIIIGARDAGAQDAGAAYVVFWRA